MQFNYYSILGKVQEEITYVKFYRGESQVHCPMEGCHGILRRMWPCSKTVATYHDIVILRIFFLSWKNIGIRIFRVAVLGHSIVLRAPICWLWLGIRIEVFANLLCIRHFLILKFWWWICGIGRIVGTFCLIFGLNGFNFFGGALAHLVWDKTSLGWENVLLEVTTCAT